MKPEDLDFLHEAMCNLDNEARLREFQSQNALLKTLAKHQPKKESEFKIK